MPLRICRICGLEAHVEQELDLFSKHYTAKYGRDNICKKCKVIYTKNLMLSNPDYYKTVIESNRQWRINNPDKIKKYLGRTIRFKKQNIHLLDSPRIGICSLCGKVKLPEERQFDIHHIIYDEEKPTANTIELCRSCHCKLRIR